MNLYDVTVEALMIEDVLREMEGELTPELEQRLDALLANGKTSLETAARVVKSLEASADACEAESIRLHARKQMFEKNATALTSRMLAAVDTAFSGKLKTPLFTIWGQSSADTVSFDLAPDVDITRMPSTYVRTTYALNKELLKVAHKQGDLPAEVVATENPGTRYLRIK